MAACDEKAVAWARRPYAQGGITHADLNVSLFVDRGEHGIRHVPERFLRVADGARIIQVVQQAMACVGIGGEQ